jgi:hypothetical protein
LVYFIVGHEVKSVMVVEIMIYAEEIAEIEEDEGMNN